MFILQIEYNNIKYRRFITKTSRIICVYKIKGLFL